MWIFFIQRVETKILAAAVWTALCLQMKTTAQASKLHPLPPLPQSINTLEESSTASGQTIKNSIISHPASGIMQQLLLAPAMIQCLGVRFTIQ